MQAEVKGTTMPILQVSLEQGEEVVSTHGELAWMTPSIQMSQTTSTGGAGGGGGGGLMQGLKRMVGGGGLFLTRYRGPGAITFAAKVPGHIVPVDIDAGQAYYVHRHGWLCGTAGIMPSIGLQQSFGGGLYGGDGFILQKLSGQGRAWIELSGELTSYELPPGQTLMVHPGHVGMFQGTVQFQITQVPGIANMFFGGDGFHLVALTGPGQIWLQSMPLAVLAHALSEYLGTNDRPVAVAGGGAMGGIIGDMLHG
ncbi:MAG: AIM24 family protein [Streptosporangiaceae bacterium]